MSSTSHISELMAFFAFFLSLLYIYSIRAQAHMMAAGFVSYAEPVITVVTEWQFKGVVFADLNAINAMYATHHVAADPVEAAALALKTGVDIDLGAYSYGGFLKEALHRGLISEADIDRAVRHVLQLKYDLGLFDNPYVDEYLAEQNVGSAENAQLAKQVALESAVLLKNDGILPFDETIKKIDVIGPNADNM